MSLNEFDEFVHQNKDQSTNKYGKANFASNMPQIQ